MAEPWMLDGSFVGGGMAVGLRRRLSVWWTAKMWPLITSWLLDRFRWFQLWLCGSDAALDVHVGRCSRRRSL